MKFGSEAEALNKLPLGVFGTSAAITILTGYVLQKFGLPMSFDLLPAAVSAFTGAGAILDAATRTNLDDFFTNTPLRNAKGIYPKVTQKLSDEFTTTYYIKLPDGLSTDDFVAWQQPVEQYLNRRISIGWDNGLMTITSYRPLKKTYPYESIPCIRPLEICPAWDVYGPYHLNIEEAPHILLAGETGAGKSVALRAIITSLILTKSPENVRLNLVDFQRVELGIFRKCQMVDSYVTTPAQFVELLDGLSLESDRRLSLFDPENIVNIGAYNKHHPKVKLPYIVVVVDEFAALAQKNEDCKKALEKLIVRTGQDRKCGIHYILSTQHPTVDIISGTIKANIPCRIALKCVTSKDSEVILNEKGAETLRGAGNAFVKFAEKEEIQFMHLEVEDALKLVEHTFVEKQEAHGDTVQTGVIGSAHTARQAHSPIY